MKEIRIHYVDFWLGFDADSFIFTKILRNKYKVVLDSINPDYVFCSHFGTDYLKYHCVRILYLGEAKAPDFNLYDYAIAFDDIVFGDRYLRYPHYLLDEDKLQKALVKHTFSDEYYLSKKKFCNYVVSNGSGAEERDSYFDVLSQYKLVDSGGRYRNNQPEGKPVEDKFKFQTEFRYSFAFENSSFPGYITEKIIDAWAANTVPIYWGAKDIAEEFNEKAFINCNNMKSPDELVNLIKQMEEHPEIYLQMMKEPITNNARSKQMIEGEYLERFIYAIFDQESQNAYRRSSKYTMWGKAYENHQLRWSEIEHKKWFVKLRDISRKIRKN